MGARAGRDQLMGSQEEGREWGTGDKGRRGEQCCARSRLVSCLPHGASHMVLASFPLFRERLKNRAVPWCSDGCCKWPSHFLPFGSKEIWSSYTDHSVHFSLSLH